MGRGWLGAGILVVFLVLGLWISSLMGSAHLPVSEQLSQAADKTLAGEFDEAVRLGMEAKEMWQKQWRGTAVVADHSPMDDVDALFAQLEIYGKTGEEPHFAACCQELSKRLQAVAEAHRFSWWNVF